jgi:hypothetical protein
MPRDLCMKIHDKVQLAIHLMLYNGEAHLKDFPKMQDQTWVLTCGRPLVWEMPHPRAL